MNSLKAIIFDMDGVLLDSESLHYEVMKGMLEGRGASFPLQEFLPYCGVPERLMWPELFERKNLGPCDVEGLMEEHWSRYMLLLKEKDYAPYPGTGAFLNSLRQEGLALAVASSSTQEKIHEYLSHLGYLEYFSQLVSGMNCERPKPAPDIFLLAASRLGVCPENCLVIEDGRAGMTAARAAGMPVVGFCGASIPMDMSLAYQSFSDYRQMSVEALKQWFWQASEAQRAEKEENEGKP